MKGASVIKLIAPILFSIEFFHRHKAIFTSRVSIIQVKAIVAGVIAGG